MDKNSASYNNFLDVIAYEVKYKLERNQLCHNIGGRIEHLEDILKIVKKKVPDANYVQIGDNSDAIFFRKTDKVKLIKELEARKKEVMKRIGEINNAINLVS